MANIEGEVAFRAEDRELRKAKIVMTDKNMQDKNRRKACSCFSIDFKTSRNDTLVTAAELCACSWKVMIVPVSI